MIQFTLRPWKKSDAPSVARYANNEKIARNLRDGFPHPYTLADAEAFIDVALSGKEGIHLYAIDVKGEAVGSIGATIGTDIYRINAEIGYWLAEEYWGEGIITKAISQLTSIIFDTYPEIIRVYAEPFADNRASAKALEKAGFRLEATFRKNVIKRGVIKDSLIYSVLRPGI